MSRPMSMSGLLYVADDVSAMDTLPSDRQGPQGVTVLRTVNLATGAIETVGADPLNNGAIALRAGMPGIAVDKAGNVYVGVADYGCRIRKVDPGGAVTDLAGGERGGSDGKGAAATFCQYDGPYASSGTNTEKDMSNLVFDTAGNLVIADTTNHTIRRVTPAGDVSTVAGRRRSPWPNVDGPGSSAQFLLNFYETVTLNPRFAFRSHYGLAADAAGNVYVAENDRIRKIAPDGRVGTMPSPSGGLVRAVLNLGGLPFGGNALLRDAYGPPERINADGSLAPLPGVTGWLGENQVVVDALGNVYWLDTTTTNAAPTVVRRTAPDGTVTTMPDRAETLGTPDADGNLWNVLGDGTVTRRGPDGKLAVVRTVAATPGAVPLAVARDRAGNLYVAWHETPNWYSVHKILPSGVDSVIAGTPGAYGVRLGAPGCLGAIDALTVGMDDHVYVISENAVLRIGQ